MFAKYQHFGELGEFHHSSFPRIPHHLSLRSPTKSPRKLVAAAATAEEAVLVHQSRIFGRKIPHVVPKNPQHGVSGLPGSMSLTASITLGGSKKAAPNMPLTRTG